MPRSAPYRELSWAGRRVRACEHRLEYHELSSPESSREQCDVSNGKLDDF
jgi:hypothetical protein